MESSKDAEEPSTLFNNVIHAIEVLTTKAGTSRNKISDYLVSRKMIPEENAKAQVSKALYKGVIEGQVGLQKGTRDFIILEKNLHVSHKNEQAEAVLNFVVTLPNIMTRDTANVAKLLHKGLREGVLGVKKGSKLIFLLESFHASQGNTRASTTDGAGDLDHQRDEVFLFLVSWGFLKPHTAAMLKELHEQVMRRVTEEAPH